MLLRAAIAELKQIALDEPKTTSETKKLLVENHMHEVTEVFNAESFDDYIGADLNAHDGYEESMETEAQVAKLEFGDAQYTSETVGEDSNDESALCCLIHQSEDGVTKEGFKPIDTDPMSELESVPLPIDDELEIPSPEEFEGYNGNGTYTTNQGDRSETFLSCPQSVNRLH